jgi:hypothetical protein
LENASQGRFPVIKYNDDVIRLTFTLASVLSLLLCVATVVLWVRSFFVPSVGEEFLYLGPTARIMLERGGDVEVVLWSPLQFQFNIPLWPIALTTAVLPAYRWLPSRKPQRGHCPTCSYNLTGNTSGVCPECGTATGNPFAKIAS